MADLLEPEKPIGIDDWCRRIFDDEVVFCSRKQYEKSGVEQLVSQYPCVKGFYVTDAPTAYNPCTRILAGPFPTLEIAIASIALTS